MIFILSKVFWTVLNPGNLILFGLLAGCLGLLSPWQRLRRWARALLGLTVAAVLIIAATPLGDWLLTPLEARFPAPVAMPARVDGVIALGGAIDTRISASRGRPELTLYADRITTFAALARRYPDAKLIYSGGSASLRDQVHKESDYARALLWDLGLDPERVIFEREARNTHENALNAKNLAKPRDGETWLLVTSAFHMPRSVGVFRRVGWPVISYPVDYFTASTGERHFGVNLLGGLQRTSTGLKEWIGLAVYRLLGWTDSLFPGPRISD